MTYLSELLGQVIGSLLRNKLRSFLTMAGIAWGIASIVLIVAMGDGFKEGQRNNMKALGENIVILFGGRTEMQAGGERAGRRIRLNYADVENIRRECLPGEDRGGGTGRQRPRDQPLQQRLVRCQRRGGVLSRNCAPYRSARDGSSANRTKRTASASASSAST